MALLHLIWIVPLFVLLAYLSSPRFRGDIAERRVRRILAQGLESSRYTVLNDIVVPVGGGTIGIDHVIVSRFGIFVIESVHLPGHVHATQQMAQWKRRRFGRTVKFDNPHHTNQVQADALGGVLGMSARYMHTFVVCDGADTIKGDPPANLVRPERLVREIRRRGQLLLEPEQTARALKDIRDAHIETRRGFLKARSW